MDEIVKFLASKIGYTITVILGFIIPGVMFVFVWKRELFLELDIVKLIILGFGIAFILYIPSLLFSTFVFMLTDKIENKERNIHSVFVVPTALNVIVMIFAMTIKILNNTYSMLDFIKEIGVPIVVSVLFMGVLTLLPNCVWDILKRVKLWIKNKLRK